MLFVKVIREADAVFMKYLEKNLVTKHRKGQRSKTNHFVLQSVLVFDR